MMKSDQSEEDLIKAVREKKKCFSFFCCFFKKSKSKNCLQ